MFIVYTGSNIILKYTEDFIKDNSPNFLLSFVFIFFFHTFDLYWI